MRLCSWFAGIDLDSRAVTATLGCSTDDGPPRVLGCQQVSLAPALPTSSIHQPSVLDAVSRFAEWFHLESGGALELVTLAIPDSSIQEVPVSGELRFGTPTRVNRATIADARERALFGVSSLGTFVTYVDRSFELDGRRYDEEPVGQYASEIRVEGVAWIAPTAVVDPVIEVLQRSGLDVGLIVPQSDAVAESVLTEVERREGAIVVTINDAESSVAVRHNSALVDLFTLPLGQAPLLNELARACSVSVDVVGRLDLGLMLDRVPSDPMVQRVRTVMSGWGTALFTGIRRRLDNRDLTWRLQAGAVIVASPASLPTLDDCAARTLGMPARFAAMSQVARRSAVGKPATFASLGLLPLEWRSLVEEVGPGSPDVAGIGDREATDVMRRADMGGRGGFGQAIGRWLREFVPADH